MIHSTVFSMSKIFWGGTLLFIDVAFLTPSFSLLWVVVGAIVVDFITGITKAKLKGEERTSQGYRKTIVKLSQYVIPILVMFAISWVAKDKAPQHLLTIKQINGFLMYFILYIEITSIFENLYEIDNKTVIAKYLYRPALKLLKFGIENNPVTAAADKLEEKPTAKP